MRAGGADPPRPNGERRPHGMRRDLQDLRKLPRSAFVSYQKKHAQPHSPRSRAEARQRLAYPSLSAFAPHRFWRWVSEYWRFRIGRRHPFQTYDGEGGDNGIYRLRGDAREIRIALAGDWGTGTDEAAEVAALIEAWLRTIRSISATSITSETLRRSARISSASVTLAISSRHANGR
jgi:hypothetical protein